MYVLKIDFPTGVAYFTGKKKVVQGTESPGLTDTVDEARIFDSEEEAAKFCKMLIRNYDMEFYYSELKSLEDEKSEEQIDFVVDISEEIEKEIEEGAASAQEDDTTP